ncbi:hypothetical protein [Amphritea sp. HPY]|uniref:hypothetical protein n=1 Tax=Amphritea sp. HPY TaxID=3421652 RepID=UPI003D7DC686
MSILNRPVNRTIISVTDPFYGEADSEPPLLTEKVVPSSFGSRREAVLLACGIAAPAQSALPADTQILDPQTLEKHELNLLTLRFKKLFRKYKGEGSTAIYSFIIDNWCLDFPRTVAAVATLRQDLACVIEGSELRQKFMLQSEDIQNAILN